MKKFITLSIAAMIAAGMTACGGSSGTPAEEAPAEQAGYNDGTYTAEMFAFDDNSGYKDNVTLVISGGKITSVEWNATKEDGGDDKRTASEKGDYDMKVAGAASDWHEQAAAMEAKIIETQDPAAIPLNEDGTTDAVSGVSINVEDFIGLVESALYEAQQ